MRVPNPDWLCTSMFFGVSHDVHLRFAANSPEDRGKVRAFEFMMLPLLVRVRP